MKKLLSLILCAIFCILALCACTTDQPDTSGSDASVDAPSANISYDEVSYIIPGGDDPSDEESQAVSSGETSEPSDMTAESSADNNQSTQSNTSLETSQPEQQSGGFVVKLAKYDYNNYAEKKLGNDCEDGPFKDVSIAILDITNETDKHYSVTIKGSYLDKDGKVLKTETQEWDQFAAGWQKYFLFRPEMAFDKFTYTIETEEFKGDCWKTGISQTFLNLQKINKIAYTPLVGTGDPKMWVEGLMGNICYEEDVSKQFSHGFQYLILFDEDGQVIGVYQNGMGDFILPMHNDGVVYRIYLADPDKGGKFDEWPEMFRGNVTGIIVQTWIDEVGKLKDHM